jgi:hypothetical protein
VSDPEDDENDELWQWAPPPDDYEAERAAYEAQQAANEVERRRRDAFMVELGEDPGVYGAWRRAIRKFFKNVDWDATFADWGWRIPNSQSPDPQEETREVIDPEARIDDPPQPRDI